jgi:hypothetical protein
LRLNCRYVQKLHRELYLKLHILNSWVTLSHQQDWWSTHVGGTALFELTPGKRILVRGDYDISISINKIWDFTRRVNLALLHLYQIV